MNWRLLTHAQKRRYALEADLDTLHDTDTLTLLHIAEYLQQELRYLQRPGE